jgi:predicted dehydrogenase
MGVSKTYADWRDMLAGEKLDIVSIATNSPYHAEITTACAKAGVRAVLCEKPMATRLSDADNAINACRDHGTMLFINHQRRWNPFWLAARDEIRSGAIGQVYHAVVHWSSGRLGNVGTHLFDLLRMLLDADARAVSGTLDQTDYKDSRGPNYNDQGGWGVVDFSNDVKAFIHASHIAKYPLLVRIAGSQGQMAISGKQAKIELWDGNERITSESSDKPDSLSLGIREIISCLASGGQPSSSGQDGLAALEIIMGFHVSNRMNSQWVRLPISGDDRDLEVLIG